MAANEVILTPQRIPRMLQWLLLSARAVTRCRCGHTGDRQLGGERNIDVAPKVAGKVANVGVNVGQFISAGTMIIKIDDRDARLRLSTAQAGVKQAQAAVKQAEARLGLLGGREFNASTVPEVLAADANYRQALAEQKQAEANEKRYRELTETGDVAMVTYETYRTARDTAVAKTNAARQQLDAAVNTAKAEQSGYCGPGQCRIGGDAVAGRTRLSSIRWSRLRSRVM